MLQKEAESEDYENPASESSWPSSCATASASAELLPSAPPGLKDVAVVAIQTVAAPPASVHDTSHQPSGSCFSAGLESGSGKGHRKDRSESLNLSKINESWNLAMQTLPPRDADAKVRTQCAFFQRGLL